MQETQVWSLGWKDPPEEGMATHCSILAWRTPWTEEFCGLLSMGLQRVIHSWVANTPPSSYTYTLLILGLRFHLENKRVLLIQIKMLNATGLQSSFSYYYLSFDITFTVILMHALILYCCLTFWCLWQIYLHLELYPYGYKFPTDTFIRVDFPRELLFLCVSYVAPSTVLWHINYSTSKLIITKFLVINPYFCPWENNFTLV